MFSGLANTAHSYHPTLVSDFVPRFLLTVSTEDPTILSGSLRSTLDVFGEYQDVEIVSLRLLQHSQPHVYCSSKLSDVFI